MTGWTKLFCLPLFVFVLSTVTQPWLNGVLGVQPMNRSLVKPESAVPGASNPALRGRPLPKGLWGGEQISMEVTAEQTNVEYACARGTINSKILLDSRGRFAVKGIHVVERGGPTRQDDDTQGYPVEFRGNVKGKNMRLTVTRTDTKELIGTFTLTHGHKSKLFKCR